MAKRKTAQAERFWYAVGYHDGIRGISDPPMKDTTEFLLGTIGIDIAPIYKDGWERGQKSKEEGLE